MDYSDPENHITKKPKLSSCSDSVSGSGSGSDSGSGSGFEILPRDLLLDILCRLHISSIIQFRYVSRSCYAMSHDPELPRLHHPAAANEDPTLVFHCDYPIRNQLYFVGYDGDKIVRKLSTPFCASMPEFNVVGSCNGLLCLTDSLFGESVYVFNPFTRTHIQLPKCKQFADQEVVFGFGFHPGRNEYKVVRVVYYRTQRRLFLTGNNRSNYPRSYPRSEVHVLTVGKPNGWRCLGKVSYQLDRQAKEVVSVNGRLHWVSRPSRQGRLGGIPGRTIVSFDLEDEKFKLVSKPVNRSNYHLAVIDGCLAVAVSCGYGKLEIWVMREYDVEESWTKRFDVYGAYMARNPRGDEYGMWRKAVHEKMVRVLGVMKNGEILMEYRGGRLVKYDPKWKEFKDVVFHGMPKLFRTIVHVGSLNWTHTPLSA